MPSLQPRALVDTTLDAIRQSGWSGVLLSAVRAHPRKFSIQGPSGEQLELWVYIWTVTFGGRPSLPDEYRIQMTSVASPLTLNTSPNGLTILIGYFPDLEVFAGFDLGRHTRFTQGSPSVQISLPTLRQALQDGLSFQEKENHEIAVGIRPDQLVAYALNSTTLHREGADPRTLALLSRAASLAPIGDADLRGLSTERRRIVQTVSRLSRKSNFSQQVLQAYGNRCAVTRMQLRLLDAAHILPVGAPGSVDHVTNGIAWLCNRTLWRPQDVGFVLARHTIGGDQGLPFWRFITKPYRPVSHLPSSL